MTGTRRICLRWHPTQCCCTFAWDTRGQLREPALLTQRKSWHNKNNVPCQVRLAPKSTKNKLDSHKLWSTNTRKHPPGQVTASILAAPLIPYSVAYYSNDSRHTQVITHQHLVDEVSKTEVSMNPKYCTYLQTSSLLFMLILNSIPQRRIKHF